MLFLLFEWLQNSFESRTSLRTCAFMSSYLLLGCYRLCYLQMAQHHRQLFIYSGISGLAQILAAVLWLGQSVWLFWPLCFHCCVDYPWGRGLGRELERDGLHWTFAALPFCAVTELVVRSLFVISLFMFFDRKQIVFWLLKFLLCFCSLEFLRRNNL